MPRAGSSAPILALALGALALAGCGSGGSAQSTPMSAEAAAAAKAAAAERRAVESRAPKGASPTLRAIYATFPAPKPNPEVKRSTTAIHAGIAACKGKTPLAVKEEFFATAKSNLAPEQAKMIAAIGKYAKHETKDVSFVAGQLAAHAYEAILPAAIAQYGYQGCVYALAQGLQQRLAPPKK